MGPCSISKNKTWKAIAFQVGKLGEELTIVYPSNKHFKPEGGSENMSLELRNTKLEYDEKDNLYYWESKRYPILRDDYKTKPSDSHNTIKITANAKNILKREVNVNVSEFERTIDETKSAIEKELENIIEENILHASKASEFILKEKAIINTENIEEIQLETLKLMYITFKNSDIEIRLEINNEYEWIAFYHQDIMLSEKVSDKLKNVIYSEPSLRLKLIGFMNYSLYA